MVNSTALVRFINALVAVVVCLLCAGLALASEPATKNVVMPAASILPTGVASPPIQSRVTSQSQGVEYKTAVTKAPPISQETKNSIEPGNHQGANTWLYLLLIILSVTTAVAVSVSFYLYKWKKILLCQPNTLVPEKWGSYLADLGLTVNEQTEALNKNFQHFASLTVESSNKITNLVETFMTLQKALDEKDLEIRRLKKGYDTDIIRKFLFRFIRVDQYLEECLQSDTLDKGALNQAKKMLQFAFEECGVENFSPSIGEDFRKARGVSDNPKKTATDKIEDEYKIIEIIESGYRIKAGDDYEYIVPAKVKILTA